MRQDGQCRTNFSVFKPHQKYITDLIQCCTGEANEKCWSFIQTIQTFSWSLSEILFLEYDCRARKFTIIYILLKCANCYYTRFNVPLLIAWSPLLFHCYTHFTYYKRVFLNFQLLCTSQLSQSLNWLLEDSLYINYQAINVFLDKAIS